MISFRQVSLWFHFFGFPLGFLYLDYSSLYCIVYCSVIYSAILLVLFRLLSFLFDLVSFSFVSLFSIRIIVFYISLYIVV